MKTNRRAMQVYSIGMVILVLSSCTAVGETLTAPTVVPSETHQPATNPETDEFAEGPSIKDLLSSLVGTFSDPNDFLELPRNQAQNCTIYDQAEADTPTTFHAAYIIRCKTDEYLVVLNNVKKRNRIDLQLLYGGGGYGYSCLRQCPGWDGEPWKDVDEDGLPDLVYGLATRYSASVFVIRTKPDGSMEDMLTAHPFQVSTGEFNPAQFNSAQKQVYYGYIYTDVDGNGSGEFVVTDTRWGSPSKNPDLHGMNSVLIQHIYSLKDRKFREVSATQPEFYEKTIKDFFSLAGSRVGYDGNRDSLIASQGIYHEVIFELGGGFPADVEMAKLFEGFLVCDLVGRREECWPLFWAASDLEAHPASRDGQGFDETTINWVEEKRAILAGQYETGSPFSPEP